MNLVDIFLNYYDSKVNNYYTINLENTSVTMQYDGETRFVDGNSDTLFAINGERNKFSFWLSDVDCLVSEKIFKEVIDYLYSIPSKVLSEELNKELKTNNTKKEKRMKL
jgi:hypothetical protein